MYKYETGKLPDALNICVFLLLRIDLCIITISTRNKDKRCFTVLNMHTETFNMLVSMFGIIYLTIKKNDTSFSPFKKKILIRMQNKCN